MCSVSVLQSKVACNSVKNVCWVQTTKVCLCFQKKNPVTHVTLVFFAPYQECNIAYYRGRIGKKILEWNVIDHGMKSMFAYVSYVTAPLSWYTLVSVFLLYTKF